MSYECVKLAALTERVEKLERAVKRLATCFTDGEMKYVDGKLVVTAFSGPPPAPPAPERKTVVFTEEELRYAADHGGALPCGELNEGDDEENRLRDENAKLKARVSGLESDLTNAIDRIVVLKRAMQKAIEE